MKDLNDFINNAGSHSYKKFENARARAREAQERFGGICAVLPNDEGRFVAVLIQPDDYTEALFGTNGKVVISGRI